MELNNGKKMRQYNVEKFTEILTESMINNLGVLDL